MRRSLSGLASATDIVARRAAGPMTASLNQTVVAENNPGAGSNIAAQQVMNADGGRSSCRWKRSGWTAWRHGAASKAKWSSGASSSRILASRSSEERERR